MSTSSRFDSRHTVSSPAEVDTARATGAPAEADTSPLGTQAAIASLAAVDEVDEAVEDEADSVAVAVERQKAAVMPN